MKATLLASDIIPYLPHNLSVLTKLNEVHTLCGIKGETCFLHGFTYGTDISYIKPILYPIDDFYNKILFQGEVVLPWKVLGGTYSSDFASGICFLQEILSFGDNHRGGINWYDGYKMINQLCEMKIDIFGLIGDGTAISIHDLTHSSDCATHNEPYMPNAECNCRVSLTSIESVK